MEGIDNQEGGVCKTKSMKIIMKVGQSEYFIVGLQARVLNSGSIVSMTPGAVMGQEM